MKLCDYGSMEYHKKIPFSLYHILRIAIENVFIFTRLQ